jgi:hypothetical protein
MASGTTDHPHAVSTCGICDYRRRGGWGPTPIPHTHAERLDSIRSSPGIQMGPNHQDNIGGPLCRVAECKLCDSKRRVRARDKGNEIKKLEKLSAMKAEAHKRITEATRAASTPYTLLDDDEEPMATVQYGPSMCPPPETPKRSMTELAKLAELILKKEKNMAFDQDTVNYELDKRLAVRETDRQLTAYDALGEDTYAVDSVIKISFEKDGEPFVFAAIKRGPTKASRTGKDFWHLTDGSHLTWDQLKRMLVKLDPVPTPVLLSGPSEAEVPADRPLITDK